MTPDHKFQRSGDGDCRRKMPRARIVPEVYPSLVEEALVALLGDEGLEEHGEAMSICWGALLQKSQQQRHPGSTLRVNAQVNSVW